jgi:hypothetical protein
MAPDTVSRIPDPAPDPVRGLVRASLRRRTWRVRGVSLTVRILAVNGIALALLAGSFFYLDSYRKQLLAERFKLARAEAEIAATALTEAPPSRAREVLAEIGTAQKLRLTLYDAKGGLIADSFRLAPPPFAFALQAKITRQRVTRGRELTKKQTKVLVLSAHALCPGGCNCLSRRYLASSPWPRTTWLANAARKFRRNCLEV